MPSRADVLNAIRGGAATAREIARRLGLRSTDVSRELGKMKRMGRVTSTPAKRFGNVGRPCDLWSVNESWTPKPRPKHSTETKQKLSVIRRALFPKKDPDVPLWVRPVDRRVYREIARVMDEETAATWARKAKALARAPAPAAAPVLAAEARH